MTTPDEFGARAGEWLAANLPRSADPGGRSDHPLDDAARTARHRELQRRLFDGGFAGITWPVEFGGLGLTRQHEQAFLAAAAPYELPHALHITLGILGATLLVHGTDTQKHRHLPAMLRGEETWVQLLSEPTGGSDLAGALTRATPTGDGTWLLDGAKTWTTAAQDADFGMCLVRTDFDLPKHRGLSMFVVDLHAPGVTVVPIRQSDRTEHFCEEFFQDVVLPADALVGGLGDGWTVAQTLLAVERTAVSSGGASAAAPSPVAELMALAIQAGRADDPLARQRIAEAHVLARVQTALTRRLGAGVRSGVFPPAAGSLGKLFWSENESQRLTIAVEVGGLEACVADDPDDDDTQLAGEAFLVARNLSIGGGTSEIQRNIISERVLGLPREPEPDKGMAFSQLRANAPRRRG